MFNILSSAIIYYIYNNFNFKYITINIMYFLIINDFKHYINNV